MKLQKALSTKSVHKHEREKQVLLGLVDYYLKTGTPVGSNALKEAGFEELSSATIRNYFAHLEKEGYLEQLHTSGGRIPSTKAFRFYATESYQSTVLRPKDAQLLQSLRLSETKEISLYLQQAAETLAGMTNLAVFLSAPRFDHDFIVDIKLVSIDANRILCVMITDFGVIQTEIMHTDQKLSAFSVKRIERYFHWRLTGHDKPEEMEPTEEKMAQNFYNELMVRYIVGYSNFIDEEIYRTGFSKLLHAEEFQSATVLASSLSLFENARSMRMLLRECSAHDALKFWIGDDLKPFTQTEIPCAVAAIPYRINNKAVGSIGVLGPVRIPYKHVFGVLRAFSENVSDALTRMIYKFKIEYRQPHTESLYLQKEEHRLIGQSRLMLLEDKRID